MQTYTITLEDGTEVTGTMAQLSRITGLVERSKAFGEMKPVFPKWWAGEMHLSRTKGAYVEVEEMCTPYLLNAIAWRLSGLFGEHVSDTTVRSLLLDMDFSSMLMETSLRLFQDNE